MQKTEIRTVATALRSAPEFKLEGTAVTYGALSKDLGGFYEFVSAGAFARSLADKASDVVCLFNHDNNRILGRLKNGTLKLTDSPTSLDFSCQLDKNQQQHKDLYYSVQRQDISEMSFAFAVDNADGPGEKFSDAMDPRTNQRITIRQIIKAHLFDCSPVLNPAYGDGATSVNARQFRSCDYGAPRQTQRFVQHILRTPASTIDSENRKRLLAFGTAICRDKYSNDLIADFELRQKAERIARVIERDGNLEAIAHLGAELDGE